MPLTSSIFLIAWVDVVSRLPSIMPPHIGRMLGVRTIQKDVSEFPADVIIIIISDDMSRGSNIVRISPLSPRGVLLRIEGV